MLRAIRRQLTLFLSEENETIESIRAKFNPKQYRLISAHVTLCREDEIENINKALDNIQLLNLGKPICIEFDKIRRFSDGNGVLIPSKGENKEFYELRKAILKGLFDQPRDHEAHITLMHPRNSTCTDEIFNELIQYVLPTKLYFNKISLIEQEVGGKWHVIVEYVFTEKQEITIAKKP